MSEVAAKVDNLGWTERFNNLKKRFPGVKDEEILKALELHKGHAGGWWVPHPAVFGVKVSRGGAVPAVESYRANGYWRQGTRIIGGLARQGGWLCHARAPT